MSGSDGSAETIRSSRKAQHNILQCWQQWRIQDFSHGGTDLSDTFR